MSVPKVQRFEHAELRVRDLSAALDFYTGVVGMVEIAREDGTVYLGCGLDANYDLALREGGSGVAHFAIRARQEEDLARYQKRLAEHGITVEQTGGREPNQKLGIRFEVPSGHTMEFVLVEDNRYLEPYRPAFPRRSGFCPPDVDHISLLAPDVRRMCDFLTKVLDFRLSDIIAPAAGNPDLWAAAWSRWGDLHHDVGVFATPDPETENLQHVAFAMYGIEHIKNALDLLSQEGTRLELGPGRHPVGSNIFAYFWDPGGNRVELSAEAAVLDPQTPTRFWKGFEDTLNAWGTEHERLPKTFLKGS